MKDKVVDGTEDKFLRCHCGNLLARLVPDGVEIKCRRCKRKVIIPISPERRHPKVQGDL